MIPWMYFAITMYHLDKLIEPLRLKDRNNRLLSILTINSYKLYEDSRTLAGYLSYSTYIVVETEYMLLHT